MAPLWRLFASLLGRERPAELRRFSFAPLMELAGDHASRRRCSRSQLRTAALSTVIAATTALFGVRPI